MGRLIFYVQLLDVDDDFYSILTHRVPLDDMQSLYEAFDKRQGGVEKVFVETAFSSSPAPGCPKTSRVKDWATWAAIRMNEIKGRSNMQE